MIFDTQDRLFKNIIRTLETGQFYDALHILVDIVTQERDQEKLLAYVSVFTYGFGFAGKDNWFPDPFAKKFKPTAKKPKVYSALRTKFSPPYEVLFQHVEDTAFRTLLHHVVQSITFYCENDTEAAIDEMKKARMIEGPFELVDYYMAVYYSAKKEYYQFIKFYEYLSPENRQAGFSNKYKQYRPDFITDPAQLILQMNKELEKQRERNEDMVKRYSHNWSNLLLPHTIQKVVKTISGISELSDEAVKLRRAYQNETLLGQQSVMLQLRHSDDYIKVQSHIRKGIARKGEDNVTTMTDVLNDSLEIVLFKIFFSDERTRTKRDQRIMDGFQAEGVDIDSFVEALSKLLLENNADLVSFVSEELIPVELSIEGMWKSLRLLKEEGGAYALLIEIFTELFRNVFTYGSKRTQDPIAITLNSEAIGDTPFLSLSFSNKKPDYRIASGTEEGLDSLESLLEMINVDVNKEFATSFIEVSNRESDYVVQLKLKANLLISRGDRKNHEHA